MTIDEAKQLLALKDARWTDAEFMLAAWRDHANSLADQLSTSNRRMRQARKALRCEDMKLGVREALSLLDGRKNR